MPVRVLACVDGTSASSRVLTEARRLLRDRDDKLYLLNVTVPSAGPSFDAEPGGAAAMRAEEEKVEKMAAARAKEVLDTYESRVVRSDGSATPASRILRQKSVDQLVQVLKLEEASDPLRHDYQLIPCVGDPREEIVKTVKTVGANYVVVGWRAAGTIRRVVLGSTTQHVLDHCACTVMVAKA